MVLELFHFSGSSSVCLCHVPTHLSAKWWESGWEMLPGVSLHMKLVEVHKADVKTTFFFFFPSLGCDSPAWLRTALFTSISLSSAPLGSSSFPLPACNKSQWRRACSCSRLCFPPRLHSAKGHTCSDTSELALNLRKCCQEGASFTDLLFPLHWALEAPAGINCLVLSVIRWALL